MTQISKSTIASSSTIVDSPRVFRRLIWTVFLLIVGCLLLLESQESQDPSGNVFWGCVIMVFFILSTIKFIVNAKGYVVDIENDAFTFPGGGIEAESWLSYFNPMYWLQGYKRHKRLLSEIRHISAHQKVTPSKNIYDDYGKKVWTTSAKKKNLLEVNGDFGAVLFTFTSKGKRDQLYSAIVQLNEMGFPVVGR
jgi:hypothetical protein